LLVTLLVGLVALLVVTQSGLERPATTPVADTPTAPATPTPLPRPSFNGFELPYPGAESLAVPPDLWFRNYPAGAISNPAQLAFGTADNPTKILDYYRQKLAAYTDYLEVRPANPTQFYDGLVAFKGDSMLVINVLDASKRSSFNRDSTFFKLFEQMAPDQTLLIVSYGPAPNLSSLPDLNLAGSANLTNYDFKNWPDLIEPFNAFNNYVIIRPTQAVLAVPAAFPDLVNQYKTRLTTAGYTIWYTFSNDVKTCDRVCQKNGWEVIVASRDSRLAVIRIYGPDARKDFKPAEIQNLTAQGLKSDSTLVGYWTGLDDSYRSAPRPIPDRRTASLDWAPDASYLAITKNNEVQLWKDGTALSAILENFPEPVYKLAWSPDSQTLAIASGYGIQFWSAQSRKLTPFAPGHTARLKELAWSPDGSRLASSAGCLNESSSSCDERVFLWQPNGSLVASLPGHRGSPTALLWSPDSQQLATEQNEANPNNAGTVRIWDGQGQLLQTLDAHPVFADNMAWWPGPTSHILVTGPTPGAPNQGVNFWDTNSGWLARGLPAALDNSVPTHLAFSPDGTTLAVTSNTTVQLWQYSTNQLLNTLSGHTGQINALAWSPDGKYLATAGQDGNLRLWYRAGKPLAVMSGPTNPLVAVSWSPASAGLYVLTATGDLWYSDSSALKGGFPNMRRDQAAWLPNSDKLAMYDIDGQVSLWDNKGYGTTSYYP
jgi:WD40 repeat protein